MGKINIIDKDELSNSSYENLNIKNMLKRNFYSMLKKGGFNPFSLQQTKKLSPEEIKIFNEIIANAADNLMCDMCDLVLILDEDVSSVNNTTRFLNDENKNLMREEIKRNFNIKKLC